MSWYKTAITVQDIMGEVDPSDRIVMSKNPTFKFRDVTGEQKLDMKPKGVWYALGDGWLHFVASEYSHGFGEYVYKLDVNTASMCMIHDAKSFLDFSNEYGKVNPVLGTMLYIDWARVAQSYSGIEISPYLGRFRLSDYSWYYGWDIASGCIWGDSGFNGAELIYKDIEPVSNKDYWNEDEEED